MSNCKLDRIHLPYHEARFVEAIWLRHAEATRAAAHGCEICVRNYVEKGGSVIGERLIGAWDGLPEDSTYNLWKATFEKQNGETIAAQEEVRQYLMTLPQAERAIDKWQRMNPEAHEQLQGRRHQLLKESLQETKRSWSCDDDENEADKGRKLRSGGMPSGTAEGEKWNRWQYGKDGIVHGNTTGTSSRGSRGYPDGGSGYSRSWSWQDPTWEDDRSSGHPPMDEMSFKGFLEACRTGDTEKVQLAVKQDPEVVFRRVWLNIGWCWIQMRGEDYAMVGRYQGRPCLELYSFLRWMRMDVLRRSK